MAKRSSRAASMAPKYSASALDKATDRCILENQKKRQPWKSAGTEIPQLSCEVVENFFFISATRFESLGTTHRGRMPAEARTLTVESACAMALLALRDDEDMDAADDEGVDDEEDEAWREFDLQARVDRIPHKEWAVTAKQRALDVVSGTTPCVTWWDDRGRTRDASDRTTRLLPHLRYLPTTGVYPFVVPERYCTPMEQYLRNPINYDTNGFLLLGGKTYAGYGAYPYIHARHGQVASIQEVCCAPFCTSDSHSPAPVPVLVSRR